MPPDGISISKKVSFHLQNEHKSAVWDDGVSDSTFLPKCSHFFLSLEDGQRLHLESLESLDLRDRLVPSVAEVALPSSEASYILTVPLIPASFGETSYMWKLPSRRCNRKNTSSLFDRCSFALQPLTISTSLLQHTNALLLIIFLNRIFIGYQRCYITDSNMPRILFGGEDTVSKPEGQKGATEDQAQSGQEAVEPSTKDTRMPDKMKDTEKPEKAKAEETKSSDQQNQIPIVEAPSSPAYQQPTDSASSDIFPIRRRRRMYRSLAPGYIRRQPRRLRRRLQRQIRQQHAASASASQPLQTDVSGDDLEKKPEHLRRDTIVPASRLYSQTPLSCYYDWNISLPDSISQPSRASENSTNSSLPFRSYVKRLEKEDRWW
jgi:hypothetical protein